MSLFSSKVQQFKPQKDIPLDWNGFNGGLNTFSRPTELKPNEMPQMDNIMLVGSGTPTGRWGSVNYALFGTNKVRLLDGYYNSTTSVNYLVGITDSGMFVKKSGASYVIITGASFASGYSFQSAQLAKNTYIAGSPAKFIRFDGSNLIPYVGISSPTNVSVAQLSAASGFSTWSWLITANSNTGETLGSVNKTLASLPLDLKLTSIKVSWNAVSSAPSVLSGYNVYRGTPGNETFLASLDPTATQFVDVGDAASLTIFPPLSDTTNGPIAKYIIKFDDRLILAGISGDPSKILISGRYPSHDSFSAIDGGGYAYISPDDGDDIMGIGIQHLQTTTKLIIIYKRNSTYVMSLDTITLGNYVILNPIVTQLTTSTGASSGDTLTMVENDVYSFGRKGLYSTGQEPQFLNQIRTNEITARIRPYVQSLSDQDFKEACSAYVDYKYVLSFPSRKETIIYDRQRLCFSGPWQTPFGITKWLRYFDPTGVERWLAGCDDGYVRELSSSYISDSGMIINQTLRTRKEDFGQWNMMKMLKYIYYLFKNVRGQVTANLLIEDRTGNTVVTKTATISSDLSDSGWGSDEWGAISWGDSQGTAILSGDELARYSLIYKQFRVMQIEIVCDTPNSKFEFLGFKALGVSLGPASLPSGLKL